MVVVVEYGPFEVPSSQEHVPTTCLRHVATLVHEVRLAVTHQICEVRLRLRLRKVAYAGR